MLFRQEPDVFHVRRAVCREGSDLGKELLEPAGQNDDQDFTRRGAAIAEGMGDVAGKDGEGAWTGRPAAIATLEFQVAIEYIEQFIFTLVVMQRRTTLRRCDLLNHGIRAIGLRTAYFSDNGVAQDVPNGIMDP